VLLVHLEDGRRYVADVGLGDGPATPFELPLPEQPSPPSAPRASLAWEEGGFHFHFEERGEGVWHFTHDPLGSFQGFDVDLTTSAASSREFAPYHAFYWQHPRSNYRTSGLVMQRMAANLGVLTLRSCTLKRLHPSLPGGSEILATAADQAHWLELAREHFGLPLSRVLTAEQRGALWDVAKAKHDEWYSSLKSAA